jgi:hypothetical protein
LIHVGIVVDVVVEDVVVEVEVVVVGEVKV